MKRTLATLIAIGFLFVTVFAQQQRKPGLYELFRETNRYLELYGKSFNPGKITFHHFNDLELKPYEMEKLRNDPYYGNFLSLDKDSVSDFAGIEFFQDRIADNLRQIVSHEDFMLKRNKRQALSALRGLDVCISNDNRLYNFSFDGKGGSVYQMRTSIMHYIKPWATSQNWTAGFKSRNNENERLYSAFASDGYQTIYSFKIDEKNTKYLCLGQVQTGSNLYSYYVDFVSLQNEVFVKDFEYEIRTNSTENPIAYNPQTKTLTVRYRTEAKTACNCRSESKNTKGKVVNLTKTCECVFTFDGKNFVLSKK